NQTRQPDRYVCRGYSFIRAHCLRRLEVPATGEDAESPEQLALERLEHGRAPVQRRAHSQMPSRLTCARANEQPQWIAQQIGDLLHCQNADSGRGQLDRQWQTLQLTTDL